MSNIFLKCYLVLILIHKMISLSVKCFAVEDSQYRQLYDFGCLTEMYIACPTEELMLISTDRLHHNKTT
jgi:hypothetical protein